MIKLKSPYNGKGGILEVGTVLNLSTEVEKNMVDNGIAEYFTSVPAEPPVNGSNPNPYADKNAEEMKAIIDAIDDVKELEMLLDYEQKNKDRKIVVAAITEKITSLNSVDS
ncbi:MAG: hypothetical protein ACM3TR_11530 [Caulobacteraceae bacterium]